MGLFSSFSTAPPPEMVADVGGSGALRPAVAWALLGSIAVSGPLSPDDPPLLTPGMATVWLDARGRLLTFHAVPPPLPAAPTVTPEWPPFFAEAGLDFSRFAPAEPSHAPPVGADALAAWTGADASTPPRTVAVEAAAWRGRPVFFAVLEDAEAAARTPGARYAARAAFGLLNLAILVAAAVFAWRNLRHGRGDRQGAARLAMVALVASLLSWVVEM